MLGLVKLARLPTTTATMMITLFASLSRLAQVALTETNGSVNSLEKALQISLRWQTPEPGLTVRDVSKRWRWWR